MGYGFPTPRLRWVQGRLRGRTADTALRGKRNVATPNHMVVIAWTLAEVRRVLTDVLNTPNPDLPLTDETKVAVEAVFEAVVEVIHETPNLLKRRLDS